MSACPSSRVCTPCTPGASMPGRSGPDRARPGRDHEFVVRRPRLGARGRGRGRVPGAPATSISVTSVRIRRSIPRARCSSGVRAIRSSRRLDVAAHPVRDAARRERGEVAALEGDDLQLVGPFSRRACDAADMPAASPPMTTSRSAAMGAASAREGPLALIDEIVPRGARECPAAREPARVLARRSCRLASGTGELSKGSGTRRGSFRPVGATMRQWRHGQRPPTAPRTSSSSAAGSPDSPPPTGCWRRRPGDRA